MKVLHLISSVNPKTGGPIAYAVNMAKQREKQGHTTIFISLDDPESDWVKAFPFTIFGANQNSKKFKTIVKQMAQKSDVAIIHGLWNFASIGGWCGLTSTQTPWVIFPHGMLDPYFRKIKPFKHIVKQIYWFLWQGRMLSKASRVLFTSQEEGRLAQNAFWGHQNYQPQTISYCATDQSAPPNTTELKWIKQIEGSTYLLFLSRIHPKKAIENLLEAFAQSLAIRPHLKLIIAGPGDESYVGNLKALTNKLGLGESVLWVGMLQGEEKKTAFANAEAFILASHQENFGQVVAESLSSGTPVLISKKVNIWREIVDDGAGIAAEDTVEDTTRMLKEYLSLSPACREKMRAAARPCYEKRFSVSAATADLEAVLQEAVAEAKATT